MRNFLLTITTLLISFTANSQVVFSPAGAKWHYTFQSFCLCPPGFVPSEANIKIEYLRDSLIGGDVLKILKHPIFYKHCGDEAILTLIKQKGDTVFMRNERTGQTWQILYNFNVVAGQSWITNLMGGYAFSTPTPFSYTISVDSVKFINENNFTLKQLFVKYYHNINSKHSTAITERFGSSSFLFNYFDPARSACDAGYDLKRYLCYEDLQFGLKQFYNLPCNFSNLANVPESIFDNGLTIFPSPASRILSAQFKNEIPVEDLEIQLYNLVGRLECIDNMETIKGGFRIDVGHLLSGIYFLQVFEKGRLITAWKFIKD